MIIIILNLQMIQNIYYLSNKIIKNNEKYQTFFQIEKKINYLN